MIDLIDEDAPIAYVDLRVGRRAQEWIVLRCPFCGDRHHHGAGAVGEDPDLYLGGRVPHCSVTTKAPDYRLVRWNGEPLPSKAEVRAATRVRIERIPIDRAVKAVVWARTEGRCWYCGRQTNPYDDFAVDHVIPVAAGGTNDADNLAPSCRTCNGRKGASDVESLRRYMASGVFWFEHGLRGDVFRIGERVSHERFGDGVVVGQDAANGEAVSIVEFDGAPKPRRIVTSFLAAAS